MAALPVIPQTITLEGFLNLIFMGKLLETRLNLYSLANLSEKYMENSSAPNISLSLKKQCKFGSLM